MQFQHVARSVVAAECAARLQRHAGVAARGQVQFNDRVRGREHCVDVAVALREEGGFGVAAGRELAGLGASIEQRRQFLDLDRDQFGRILGNIRVFREHRGDRLADITHLVRGQHRLAVRRELLDRPLAEIDRADVVDVFRGPHRDHARQRARFARIDRNDAAVRVIGAHHPHVKLAGEIDVGGKTAFAGDQRRIL